MSLWIRSQDKKRLIESNGVALTPSGLSIYPIGANGILGTYETEERALEVLDEICEQITSANKVVIKVPDGVTRQDIESAKLYLESLNQNKIELYPNDAEIVSVNKEVDVVYEMPKE